MTIKYCIVLIAVVLAACDVDSAFLFPGKFSADARNVVLIDQANRDTVIVHFDNDLRPVFMNVQNDTIDAGCKIENVTFKNELGTALYGWMLSPHSAFNGMTILFLHGNAGDITEHYQRVLPFVQRGFRVFLFDYSGYGFSEGEASRDNVLRDATAAVRYMANNYELNCDMLLLYGQSLGGHLAVTVAATNQEKIDGLIIEGAFSSHKNIAAAKVGLLGRLIVAEKYSGLEAIQQWNKPLLVIHSIDDQTVPFELGKELYDNANEPKSLYQIKGRHVCGPLYYADSIAYRITTMMAVASAKGN